MDGNPAGGTRPMSSLSSSTRNSKLIIQNGSFFYPKKAGFRETAKYAEPLGERNLKRYTQQPGGEQTVKLGSDVVPLTSTTEDAQWMAADPLAKASVDALPLAGASNKAIRDRNERLVTMRVAQPPGGFQHVNYFVVNGPDSYVADDVNPDDAGIAPKLSSPARAKHEAGVAAGILYMGPGGTPVDSHRVVRRPLQDIGGNSTLTLCDDGAPLPTMSLMAEDLLLAHHPVVQGAAVDMPAHGGRVDKDEWDHKRRVAGAWTQSVVEVKDASPTVAPATVWELDVAKTLRAHQQEKENSNHLGLCPHHAEASKFDQFAGKRVNVDGERFGLRRFAQAYATSLVLNYATERDDVAAAKSPPRAKGIPLHADPRTLSAKRRPAADDVHAATCIGAPLIGGAGGSGEFKSEYQTACSGEPTHFVAPRRSLVKRLQNTGGRTTVSLAFDPEAAGVRTVLEHDGENPITAGAPPYNPFAPPPVPEHGVTGFGQQPVPSHFGKRVTYARKSSPMIVMGDTSQVGAFRDDNMPVIRRVAPPGGITNVAIA